MHIGKVKYNEPKTKKAALVLAVQASSQIDIIRRRKENIMNYEKSVTEKIEKLQLKLGELERQIQACDSTTQNWQTVLEDLKVKFALTEAEILELKSSQLRKQISLLERDLNYHKDHDVNI